MALARTSDGASALQAVLQSLPSVRVEESAWAVGPYLDEAAAGAVSQALREMASQLTIDRVEGSVAPDDATWRQLVLVVGATGKPGSPRWRAALEAAAEVMRRAAERCPAAAPNIATQFTFDL